MPEMRFSWRLNAPGLLVSACALVLYLALVPVTVMGGDNGEFALLASADGIAHPPGYPLYVGLLKLFRWLPASTPVQAAGSVTAVIAALQMLAMYVAARCWRLPVLAASIAVACYAGSPLVIQHLTHAEVFALNGLIVALIVALASPFGWLSGAWRVVLLGLLCGFGCAHHHSFVLLFPLMLVAAAVGLSELRRDQRLPVIGLGLMAMGLGFLPSLLLFPWSQSDHVYLQSWGVISDWSAFWGHFLRRDYGTFRLSPGSDVAQVDLLAQMFYLLKALQGAWKLLLPCALVAFAVRLSRMDRRFWAWLGLFLSFMAASVLFFSRANIALVEGSPGLEVLQRFYLLPTQLLVLPVAEGLRLVARLVQRLLSTLAARRAAAPPWMMLSGLTGPVLSSVLAVYALGFNAVLSERQTRIARGPHTQNFVLNGLLSLPRNAVLVVRADDEMYAGSYLQQVAGYRPDLVLVNASFLQSDWYITRLSRRLEGCRWPRSTISGFLGYVVQHCRLPVFVTMADDQSGFAKALYRRHPSHQYGLFRRVLPIGEPLPDAQAVFTLNRRLFSAFKLPERQIRQAHGWASWPSVVYDAAWLSVARDMSRSQRPDLAAAARRLAVRYGPCQDDTCLSD